MDFKNSPVLYLPENTRGRDFAIGDVHGHFDYVLDLMKHVNFNRDRDRIFFVGDLVDRGEQSIEALKFLENDFAYSVKGNHEDILAQAGTNALAALVSGRNPMAALGSVITWRNGNAWMLESLSKKGFHWMGDIVSCMAGLPLVIVTAVNGQRVNIVHAGCINRLNGDTYTDRQLDTITGNDEDIEILLWSREAVRRIHSAKGGVHLDGLSPVICGHTGVDRPVMASSHVFIDTLVYLDRPDSHCTGLTLMNMETGIWHCRQRQGGFVSGKIHEYALAVCALDLPPSPTRNSMLSNRALA